MYLNHVVENNDVMQQIGLVTVTELIYLVKQSDKHLTEIAVC